MGTLGLDPKFQLSSFFVNIDHSSDTSELTQFIDQIVPFAFKDPILKQTFLICKNRKDLLRAKAARLKAKTGTTYPDYCALLVFQGTHVFWYRPPAGLADPVGTWVLINWLQSKQTITIEICV